MKTPTPTPTSKFNSNEKQTPEFMEQEAAFEALLSGRTIRSGYLVSSAPEETPEFLENMAAFNALSQDEKIAMLREIYRDGRPSESH